MSRWAGRALLALAGAATLLVALPGAASAHPLGNFTVNRYSGVAVAVDEVRVDHVLDIAEIPTAQRRVDVDTSGDGRMSRAELAEWAGVVCAAAAADLRVVVGARTVRLDVATAAARATDGQAGLPVLRLECALAAPVPALSGPTTVEVEDSAADGEVGWKEVTAVGDGTTLTRSDVPDRTRSGRLTSYPKDLLSSPLDTRSARLEVRPGGTHLQPVSQSDLPTGVLARGADRLTVAFEGLLERSGGGPLAALLALVAALVLGAAHAVAPGHGKTVMAFYLSGRRDGALRSAATVGVTVTATHTAGVLALGLLVSAGTAFVPARVYPWLSLASGVLVVAVGLTLLRAARTGGHGHTHGTAPGQHTHGTAPSKHTHGPSPHPPLSGDHAVPGLRDLPAPRPATTHPHPRVDHAAVGILVHDPSDHPHPHEHTDEPAHAHDGPAPSRGGLVAIGLAGGLLPSPSALLVFLGALALGHPWFGVTLVVAFGVGMAATLAAAGVAVMTMRERAERRLALRPRSRFAPVLRYAPLVTATVVVVLGLGLAARGIGGTGLL